MKLTTNIIIFYYFLYRSVFLLNKEVVSGIQALCKQYCVLDLHANLVSCSFSVLCCATSEVAAKGCVIAEGPERMAEERRSSFHSEVLLRQLGPSANSSPDSQGIPEWFPEMTPA